MQRVRQRVQGGSGRAPCTLVGTRARKMQSAARKQSGTNAAPHLDPQRKALRTKARGGQSACMKVATGRRACAAAHTRTLCSRGFAWTPGAAGSSMQQCCWRHVCHLDCHFTPAPRTPVHLIKVMQAAAAAAAMLHAGCDGECRSCSAMLCAHMHTTHAHAYKQTHTCTHTQGISAAIPLSLSLCLYLSLSLISSPGQRSQSPAASPAASQLCHRPAAAARPRWRHCWRSLSMACCRHAARLCCCMQQPAAGMQQRQAGTQ